MLDSDSFHLPLRDFILCFSSFSLDILWPLLVKSYYFLDQTKASSKNLHFKTNYSNSPVKQPIARGFESDFMKLYNGEEKKLSQESYEKMEKISTERDDTYTQGCLIEFHKIISHAVFNHNLFNESVISLYSGVKLAVSRKSESEQISF